MDKYINVKASKQLEILYQDEYIVAINKPCGYLVHRSKIARDAKFIVLQILRDQIGQRVFPIHRLDRKTSGVLLFALDPETNRALGEQFAERSVKKEYTAIVRGWIDDSGTVDYALTNDNGKTQDALTHYKCTERFEIDLPLGHFDTSRYSHILVKPETGRMHQIRKHMNHLRHPILGDRPHGCSKQNRLWKSKFDMTEMLLHAQKLTVQHPVNGKEITFEAGYPENYKKVLSILRRSDLGIFINNEYPHA